MDITNLALFQVMKAKMGYLSQRQAILAQNVANADTPGYRARDVEAPDFKKLAMSYGGSGSNNLAMARTSRGHIVAPLMSTGQFADIKRRNTDELNPNDNNVSTEEEMAKIAENQAEYNKVTSLYSKTIALLTTAVGRPSGS
ncbi:MAG: flagellar basal body rod protein FlgB [Alphaproteobacteria bacterium]|nr:flagellar basal body rod protein FlgB [Alphaproteobacteria bacterium]